MSKPPSTLVAGSSMEEPGDNQPPGGADIVNRTNPDLASPDSIAPDLITLVRQYQAGLWRYLRALGCDATTAEDLIQETFLRVLHRPFEHRNDAATGAYLRRVAHNLFISHRRRATKVSLTERASDLEEAWTRWAGFDNGDSTIESLRECMERLTERAQLALRKRFANETSRTEIGEELGISEHGAKNLMQRAKAQLRDCLESKLK